MDRLGAHNSVALRDLLVFVEQAAEAVTSVDTNVSARAWVGQWHAEVQPARGHGAGDGGLLRPA
jgi:hypothetical protein